MIYFPALLKFVFLSKIKQLSTSNYNSRFLKWILQKLNQWEVDSQFCFNSHGKDSALLWRTRAGAGLERGGATWLESLAWVKGWGPWDVTYLCKWCFANLRLSHLDASKRVINIMPTCQPHPSRKRKSRPEYCCFLGSELEGGACISSRGLL